MFTADHQQTSGGGDTVARVRIAICTAKANIGAAAGHRGGDGDGIRQSGLRDDARLVGVMLGVQDRE